MPLIFMYIQIVGNCAQQINRDRTSVKLNILYRGSQNIHKDVDKKGTR